jgi:2-methylisocitrate lyase-like PEP mutase family enzyme
MLANPPKNMDLPTFQYSRNSLAELIQGLDGRLLIAVGIANGAEARAFHRHLAALDAAGAVPGFVGGFVFFVSGYLTAAERGLPDLGMVLREEIVRQTDIIEQATWLASLDSGTPAPPIGVDIDTGYGNEPSAILLTCHQVHKQGAQYVQIEDQYAINKSCGHLDGAAGRGKDVIDAQEMVETRLKPAIAYAKSVDDLCVMARTDALSTKGYDEALRRARLYADAGAELVFVEAPESEAQLSAVARDLADSAALSVANVVEGSRKTPYKTPRELHELGFDLALFPVGPLLAGHAARETYYQRLIASSSTEEIAAGKDGFEQFSEMIGRDQFTQWNRRFRFE